MTVYVDELRRTQRSKAWHYGEACHLVADGLEELHAFARRLRLKHHWFQDGRFPHYDLTKHRRRVALTLGAEEITAREWIRRARSPMTESKAT